MQRSVAKNKSPENFGLVTKTGLCLGKMDQRLSVGISCEIVTITAAHPRMS